MKFLVDMNLSPGWIDLLVKARFEAAHWSSIGRGNESDAELMRWAAEHGHVVLTADLDFGAILAATQRRAPSVIQIRADVPTARSRTSCGNSQRGAGLTLEKVQRRNPPHQPLTPACRRAPE